jgi:hypothetical protein
MESRESMDQKYIRPSLLALIAASIVPVRGGAAALVDVILEPSTQSVCVGDVVTIELRLVSDGAPQPFQAVDAIIAWDPGVLLLVGFDDSNAGANWFLSGFLPDPDMINDDLTDGEALYTALAPIGGTLFAPPAPGSFLVTEFSFTVTTATAGTAISLTPSSGAFGQTRVLLEGAPVTGAIRGPADVIASTPSCPADFNCDSNVDALDFLRLIAQWGSPCTGPCDADITGPDPFVPDGNVDALDYLVVISQWGNPGNCP